MRSPGRGTFLIVVPFVLYNWWCGRRGLNPQGSGPLIRTPTGTQARSVCHFRHYRIEVRLGPIQRPFDKA